MTKKPTYMPPEDAAFLKMCAGATFHQDATFPSGTTYTGEELTALAAYYAPPKQQPNH